MFNNRKFKSWKPLKQMSAIFALVVLTQGAFAQSATGTAKGEEVRMWEETITLPTYKVGEADKNPLFYTPAEYQGAQRHIYPYAFRGDLTNEKVNVDYKGVFLENEYLKICITPEMGGRLYYAVDKTNDYNIVYYNKVVKPALIGMAGAWTSGGAEWNIPHHHRPTSFLPVDYTLVENEDGSKTVWVGEYEKRHQTRWLVGLTLEPGKAYVKTEFRYLNVTPVENSFLFWTNTAVHANENYQVIFPPDVEKAVFHAKTEFTNWPIANQEYQGIDFTDGQDISWWKNTSSPTSFFAWDTKQDFIAGIDHGKEAGTVKVGDRHIFQGKKFWNWGPNEVGQRWDEKLTDNDGPYLELMMGAYSNNQPDYSFINPMSTQKGTMYYYGIKNMDNIKQATHDFAINLEKKQNRAIVQVNATGVNEHLEISLTNKGEEVWKETINIDPFKPFSKEVKIAEGTVFTDLVIQLTSAEGKELARWQPQPKKNKPHPETYEDPADPQEYQSDDKLWLAGLRLEQFGNANFDPEKYYRAALEMDPDDVLINTQLGISYLKKGMHAEAEEYLRKATNEVTDNYTKPKFSEPLYYLGVSLMNQERHDEASELLYQAAWDYEWKSPAYTLLAQIESLRGDWGRAVQNAERAILANPLNIEAQNLKAMIQRHRGDYEEALSTAKIALQVDPLNFNSMYEVYLLSDKLDTGIDGDQWREKLSAKLRNEADSYLEGASRYGKAGLYQDAIGFLNLTLTSGNKELQEHPMINYHLAYYHDLNGDEEKASEFSQIASRQTVDFVFPYGETSEKVLHAAVERDLDDATAYYYLGNVYADYQPERAVKAWKRAIELNDDVGIFYRNLAFAQANFTNNIDAAVENIMKAIKLDPQDARYFAEAGDYMAYARVDPERIAEFIKENAALTEDNVDVKATEIRLSNFFKEYDNSISLLKNTHFRTEEGADFNIHVYWFDAHLLRGIEKMKSGRYEEAEKDFLRAMEFPENLESERNSKIGVAYYYLGMNNKMKGNKKEASQYFNQMVNYNYQAGWGAGSFPEIDYYKGLAAEELGKQSEAEEYFQRLSNNGDRRLAAEEQGQYSRSSVLHAGRVEPSFARRKATNEAHADAYYSIGLALLGQGKPEEAEKMFSEALEMNRTHIGAKTHMSNSPRLGSR